MFAPIRDLVILIQGVVLVRLDHVIQQFDILLLHWSTVRLDEGPEAIRNVILRLVHVIILLLGFGLQ